MTKTKPTGLSRTLGLTGLVATGICSMLGASINVVPFMIHRNVPGIGAGVLGAFILAAVPALLAAFAYAILSSAMPRAGGSYIFSSRGLNPYLGFIASFAHWFGLTMAIGVVAFVIPTFFRDMAVSLEWNGAIVFFSSDLVRLLLALGLIWIFVLVNMAGLKQYERILIPMMIGMFVLGSIVIFSGMLYNQQDFLNVTGYEIKASPRAGNLGIFFAAAAVLFSSFIGFDAIAQAGGEAKNPSKNLPMAILISIFSVGIFYFLFTISVYKVVPWQFVADQAGQMDVSAPGLLGYLLPVGMSVAILGGAALALINDLPAMLLSVSRLMFAWAEDEIFPAAMAKVNPQRHTPVNALLASGLMASIGVLGCHFAGDFFLGIDLMVTSMLVNFLFMCLAVLFLPKRNPELAAKITVIKNRSVQIAIAVCGIIALTLFLIIHILKDAQAELDSWYFHSTPIWLFVMAVASLIYLREVRELKNKGTDLQTHFLNLPPE